MPETKHTPGRYMVIHSHRGVPHIACEGPAGGLIARCDTNKPAAENEANARLIAAAPDLLDVLRRLTTWNNDKNGDGIQLDRICRAAQKAIKNAEGK